MLGYYFDISSHKKNINNMYEVKKNMEKIELNICGFKNPV